MQKNSFYICLIICFISIVSCVQKKYKRVVVVQVNTAHIQQKIDSVGIRGNGKPLSWRKDYPMYAVVKDSTYTTTFTIETGYKFVEIKFSMNGELELNDKENRRVYFSEGDTTYYNAKYNEIP